MISEKQETLFGYQKISVSKEKRSVSFCSIGCKLDTYIKILFCDREFFANELVEVKYNQTDVTLQMNMRSMLVTLISR